MATVDAVAAVGVWTTLISIFQVTSLLSHFQISTLNFRECDKLVIIKIKKNF